MDTLGGVIRLGSPTNPVNQGLSVSDQIKKIKEEATKHGIDYSQPFQGDLRFNPNLGESIRLDVGGKGVQGFRYSLPSAIRGGLQVEGKEPITSEEQFNKYKKTLIGNVIRKALPDYNIDQIGKYHTALYDEVGKQMGLSPITFLPTEIPKEEQPQKEYLV